MTGSIIWELIEPLIIAEVGINHNGNLETAIEMIHVAKNVGADVVKFQTFKAKEIVSGESTYTYESNGKQVTETQLEMFSRYELDEKLWPVLKSECEKAGIIFMSTPQNSSDLDVLISIGLPAIKVGSDDLVNIPMLEDYASRGLPIIISTGMSYLEEIDRALRAIGWPKNSDVSALVCTSQYPTANEFANVARVETLRNAFPGLIVGFSDHTEGNQAAVIARTLGARIFEKHFTLNKSMEGPDHSFSPDPDELRDWVTAIRSTDEILGSGVIAPDCNELVMRNIAHRSAHAGVCISAGEVITKNMVVMLRPNIGLAPHRLQELIGKKAVHDIQAGQPLHLNLVN